MEPKEKEWRKHIARAERRVQIIELLFHDAIARGVHITRNIKLEEGRIFKFKDYPQLTSLVDDLLRNLHRDVTVTLDKGIIAEWRQSNLYNDEMVNSITKTLNLPKETIQTWNDHNLDALHAFQQRKVNGMNLSQRVWNIVNEQFKTELELGLDIGIGEGRSAQQISQDIRSYLNEPNRLYRRVRDKHGQLQLSKAAKAYHPGQGVYRSSYKNAMRVSRSENNMAYRSADNTRYQQLPFVVGFEVKRSNNFYDCDVCEQFKGFYNKNFIWVSNHPNCRCHCISVLATKEEIDRLAEMILNEEDISGFKSANEIKGLPKGFTDYITDNKDKLLRMKTQPYYIRDNFKKGHVSGGLKLF